MVRQSDFVSDMKKSDKPPHREANRIYPPSSMKDENVMLQWERCVYARLVHGRCVYEKTCVKIHAWTLVQTESCRKVSCMRA